MFPEDHYRDLKKYVSAGNAHKHICMAYSNKEQQITAIAEYFSSGFRSGQQCVYVSEKGALDFVRNVLKRTGMDVDAHEKDGSLCMLTPSEAYLIDQGFDLENTINHIKQMIAKAQASGFTGVRAAGDSSWVLQTPLTGKEILAYECNVTLLFEDYPFTGLCLFDETRFHPDAIKMLIETHPSILRGGTVVENPNFLPPQEFLPRLKTEKAIPLMIA